MASPMDVLIAVLFCYIKFCGGVFLILLEYLMD
jgi:hypothetical protein